MRWQNPEPREQFVMTRVVAGIVYEDLCHLDMLGRVIIDKTYNMGFCVVSPMDDWPMNRVLVEKVG
jgi:hypothetical protein